MNSTILHFFGKALTGQGMKNVYKDLMKEAKTVYFLKGANGFKLSELLQSLGKHYHDIGVSIEYFHDPLFENNFEALFVKEPHNILFLQSTSPSFEPTLYGTRDKVISFYDCIDEVKLKQHGERIIQLNKDKEKWHDKCFHALARAIKIHDDWEIETRRHMDWNGLNKQFEQLIQNLFGKNQLKKRGNETHRLLGTLTPAGARDTLQSITQNVEKRYFIKGYPGTGKSSMMKKLAGEALNRGYDVQKVWCGLDSNSIDMVIIPELNFCIFDSTEPHVYFPDPARDGDQIFDIAQHCHPTEIEEENIKAIVAKYRSAMYDAVAYCNLYAEAERALRDLIDSSIIDEQWNNRIEQLFQD
ncbi:nucleotide kinase [Ureibacillus sp. MALMAid1270]|uniref:nucleotide kinase n=1 Tax=Ureibacillus sp. MALMAid1270 TaxID=3411629 RepID=UPI003BA78785